MFAVLRLSQAKRLSAATTSMAKPPFPLNSPTIDASSRCDHRRHKWDGTAYDHIRADMNCSRCSKQMPLLFSNRPLSITGQEAGIYQALKHFPNYQTAFYFRPFKLEPLQGSFIEIGQASSKDMEKQRDALGTRRAKVAATRQRLARRWQRRKTEVGQEVANAKGGLQGA